MLLILIFLLFQPAFGKSIHKEINFEKDSEPNAGKILYEYCLKRENMNSEQIKEIANIYPESAKAVEVDLNDDGQNEIVGIVYSTYYLGTSGYSLFILQKQNNEYKNISFENNFEPLKNLFVLKHKTNNYRDIKLYGSVAYKFHPLIIKFKDVWYASIQQLKTFEQALQQ